MSEEEYIRNRLDQININSHYGLMIDTEITKLVRDHMKEKEDNKMKATSVQNIKNINDICFDVSNDPIERESKLTIVASTDDDIFAFEFEGLDILQCCKRAGLFVGWEKDQKIRELEKENKKLETKSKDISDDNALLLETNKKLKEQIKKLEKLKTPTIENFTDEEPSDNVNHPSHYTGRYECIDVMQDVFGDEATNDFCLCNAFKYIWRARKKNGLEDVKKAVWYLNKYIEEAEDGEDKVTGT